MKFLKRKRKKKKVSKLDKFLNMSDEELSSLSEKDLILAKRVVRQSIFEVVALVIIVIGIILVTVYIF